MSELTDKMNALNKDREPVIPEPLFIAGDAMCTATCGLFNDVTGRCNSGHDGIEKIEANGMRHTPCTFFGAQGVVTPEMPPTDTERLVEVAKENYMQAKAELDAHAHQGFVALAKGDESVPASARYADYAAVRERMRVWGGLAGMGEE